MIIQISIGISTNTYVHIPRNVQMYQNKSPQTPLLGIPLSDVSRHAIFSKQRPFKHQATTNATYSNKRSCNQHAGIEY